MRTNEKLPTIEQEEIEQLKEQMEKLQQGIDEHLRSKKEEEAAATEAHHARGKVEDQTRNFEKDSKVLRNKLDELKLARETQAHVDIASATLSNSKLEDKNAKMRATLHIKKKSVQEQMEKLQQEMDEQLRSKEEEEAACSYRSQV